MTSITDGNGSTYIQNEYDEWGRVVRQTDEEGLEYQIIYNDEKQENNFIVLDSGAVTSYQYDEHLYITRVNYADGSYERFEYDDRSNRTLALQDNGIWAETGYSYDSKGRMLSVTDAKGGITTYDYAGSFYTVILSVHHLTGLIYLKVL